MSNITIREVTGGNNKSYLEQCYFQEIGSTNTFHFFQPDGTQIITQPPVVSNEKNFKFELEDKRWEVTHFLISAAHSAAKGHWKIKKHTDDEGDPETGTFQAPGGSGAELSAGATAST